MRTEHHEVLIVGAGPAGLFAAHELALKGFEDILIVDSGPEADDRECPLTRACNCRPCDILEGVGGSGGVSDGKLTFALDRGTQLEQVFQPEHAPLLAYVERVMLREDIGGVRYRPASAEVPGFGGDGSGIDFSTYDLWHVGSDGIKAFSSRFASRLRREMGIEIRSRVRAERLLSSGEGIVARMKPPGERRYEDVRLTGDKVILGVGLFGIGWLERELSDLGVVFGSGPAGIGLRVEAPAQVLAPIFDAFYDWKGVGEFQGMTLRSFCCNHHGHIMPEFHTELGIRNVNGHSYLNPEQRSNSSNFSLQAKITRDHVANPQDYVRGVARAINKLSQGWQIRQPLRDFMTGETTISPDETYVTYHPARRGDLLEALPGPLTLAFRQYLLSLDALLPGTIDSAWLYGPEIKYHARKVPIDRHNWKLQGAEDLYVVGDSTGLTGSYVSAAMTGIIAAHGIAQEIRT